MKRIDVSFLLLGSIMLVAGVGLGVMMGATHNFQLAPVHAHVNLVGWASLALFGLSYRAYPQLAGCILAKIHLALSVPSAILFPVGIYLAAVKDSPGLAIGASLLWLVGAFLFAFQIGRLALAPATADSAYPNVPAPAE